MIASLDIASVTGWAAGPPGIHTPMFGEHRMAPVGANEAVVFDNFESWLNQKIDVLRPVYMRAEDQFMAPNASRMVIQRLMGMRGICAMVCHRRGVRLRWVPVATVHRFFTGVGRHPRGEKKQATIAMCQRYGWNPQTDNQADALALWLWSEHEIAPDVAGRRSAGSLFARAS